MATTFGKLESLTSLPLFHSRTFPHQDSSSAYGESSHPTEKKKTDKYLNEQLISADFRNTVTNAKTFPRP